MRKIIVSTYMSLDGVIDDPMWTMPYWSEEISQFQHDDLFASDALLLGRETYEGFAEAWTERQGTDDFADRMNALPKYVPTRTLNKATWNATLLKGDVVAQIQTLKEQSGMNILKYGGGELLHLLIQHNLLDELHLLIFPVLVGTGTRLVPNGAEGKLTLVDTKQFSTGVVAHIYKPAAD